METSLEPVSGLPLALMAARERLAEAKTLVEVREVRDIAIAAKAFADAHRLSLEARNQAAEIHLLAEHRMGTILESMGELRGGKKGDKRQSSDRELCPKPLLADLGIDKKTAHRARLVSALPIPELEARIGALKEREERVTMGRVLAVSAASGYDGDEAMTPPDIAAMAREAMGGIDLDPASVKSANEKSIRARRFWTKEQDALAREWCGRVWLNPPYSTPLVGKFVDKLAEETRAGNIAQSIVLVNASTGSAWFHDLLSVSSALCLVRGRLSFLRMDGRAPVGDSPRYDSALAFSGPGAQTARFIDVFARIGTVLRVAARK